MSDVNTTHPGMDPGKSPASRRRARDDRQARVGLLHNPNRPPKPPPRRAALMGKWLDLRSSRRIRAAERAKVLSSAPAPTTQPPAAPPQVADTIAHDQTGQVSAIDIEGLMHAVRGVGADKPIRTPYAASYRHDLAQEAGDAAKAPKPSILTAEAWLEEPDPAPAAGDDATPPRAAASRLPRRIAALLLACLVAGALLMRFSGWVAPTL